MRSGEKDLCFKKQDHFSSLEVFGIMVNAYSPRFLFSGFRPLATQIPALTEGKALKGFYQWGKHLPEG